MPIGCQALSSTHGKEVLELKLTLCLFELGKRFAKHARFQLRTKDCWSSVNTYLREENISKCTGPKQCECQYLWMDVVLLKKNNPAGAPAPRTGKLRLPSKVPATAAGERRQTGKNKINEIKQRRNLPDQRVRNTAQNKRSCTRTQNKLTRRQLNKALNSSSRHPHK